MSERWVLNASPVIVLAKIGRTDLISQLTDEAMIPQAVIDEIVAGPQDDPARKIVLRGGFPVAQTVPHPDLLAWDLGAGETAVLSYALEAPGWTAILDDGAARRCAQAFDIPCKGTLAIVLAARKQGLISSASSLLHELLSVGFRLDENIIREALQRSVGEDWE